MLFEPKKETFFASDEEDDLSEELDMYGRIDAYLNSKEVHMQDLSDSVNKMYDDVRRNTFSEIAKVENFSMPESSPFFLSSPMESSLILDRRHSSRRIIQENDDSHFKDNDFCITKTKSCQTITVDINSEMTIDSMNNESFLDKTIKSQYFENEILSRKASN